MSAPRCIVLAFLAFVTTPAIRADFVTVFVPGASDPWLAGMPNGTTASGGDVAPGQSPVLVSGVPIVAGSVLTFHATGSSGYGSDAPAGPSGPGYSRSSGPDGMLYLGQSFIQHVAGPENGISNYKVPINALVGVFLGSSQPNPSSPPATFLDFSSTGNVAGGTGFHSLAPGLNQVFFIGDGLDGNGLVQQFLTPNGATRFFLGTADGQQWNNNVGGFEVTIDTAPEPATFSLVAMGAVLLLGSRLVRRRRITTCDHYGSQRR